jgi:hypothetical protein
MPERADTLEVIGLIMFAPLLYSTSHAAGQSRPKLHQWLVKTWFCKLLFFLPPRYYSTNKIVAHQVRFTQARNTLLEEKLTAEQRHSQMDIIKSVAADEIELPTISTNSPRKIPVLI